MKLDRIEGEVDREESATKRTARIFREGKDTLTRHDQSCRQLLQGLWTGRQTVSNAIRTNKFFQTPKPQESCQISQENTQREITKLSLWRTLTQ